MSRVTYVSLPEGGFMATAPNRPDVYLTWLKPGSSTCALNVSAHYQRDAWSARTIGRNLDWHGFQVQAETLLGVDEHALDAPAVPVHTLVFDRGITVGHCTCGHWRLAVPETLSPVAAKDTAYVAELHAEHALW